MIIQNNMFPHTVTIYNSATDFDFASGKEITVNHITILQGVLMDATKGINVRKSGLIGADAVTLYIPFDVSASDGISGNTKQYLEPIAYWNAEDKSQFWTLSTDGKGGTTFFIKGEVIEPDKDLSKIALQHEVFTVTKVDKKDFGGDMAHFEVGGV